MISAVTLVAVTFMTSGASGYAETGRGIAPSFEGDDWKLGPIRSLLPGLRGESTLSVVDGLAEEVVFLSGWSSDHEGALEAIAVAAGGEWTVAGGGRILSRDNDIWTSDRVAYDQSRESALESQFEEDRAWLSGVGVGFQRARSIISTLLDQERRLNNQLAETTFGQLTNLTSPEDILLRQLVTSIGAETLSSQALYKPVLYSTAGNSGRRQLSGEIQEFKSEYEDTLRVLSHLYGEYGSRLTHLANRASRYGEIDPENVGVVQLDLLVFRTLTTVTCQIYAYGSDGVLLGESLKHYFAEPELPFSNDPSAAARKLEAIGYSSGSLTPLSESAQIVSTFYTGKAYLEFDHNLVLETLIEADPLLPFAETLVTLSDELDKPIVALLPDEAISPSVTAVVDGVLNGYSLFAQLLSLGLIEVLDAGEYLIMRPRFLSRSVERRIDRETIGAFHEKALKNGVLTIWDLASTVRSDSVHYPSTYVWSRIVRNLLDLGVVTPSYHGTGYSLVVLSKLGQLGLRPVTQLDPSTMQELSDLATVSRATSNTSLKGYLLRTANAIRESGWSRSEISVTESHGIGVQIKDSGFITIMGSDTLGRVLMRQFSNLSDAQKRLYELEFYAGNTVSIMMTVVHPSGAVYTWQFQGGSEPLQSESVAFTDLPESFRNGVIRTMRSLAITLDNVREGLFAEESLAS